MNVAQLIFAGSFAGAEAVACSLTRALMPHTDRAILYLVQETRAGAAACAELVSRAREYDIEIRVFETQKRFCADLAIQLQQAFTEDEIDLVHSHSYKAAVYSRTLRRKMQKSLALVFTVHGFDQSSWRGAAFLHTVNGLSAFSSDIVICVSNLLATYYQRFPTLKNKVHVVANAAVKFDGKSWEEQDAIRHKMRQQIGERYHLDPEAMWCACVGRLVPVKNHQLLFEAALQCRDHNPEIEFLIAGDGPLKDQLEATRKELNVPNIHFTGHVHEMSELYSGVDCLALTSDSEGSPMVVLEAMAHGLPVIATNVGGVPDLVEDHKSGYLFAKGDPDACAALLQNLAKDPSLRAQMGAQAYRRIAEKFNADQWSRQHLKLYDEALSKH